MEPPRETDFDTVVGAELPALLRYASALCGDADQARDIVQEVLARAYPRWSRIAQTDRPAAYLMRMVTNEFLSWRRRWSTRSISLVDDTTLELASGSSDDHAESLVVRDELEQRLARLPRKQQAALVLRYFVGADYPEAAEILGCAEGTVRAACSRGLAALRLDAAEQAALLTVREI